jgi:hypothetical protein
MKSFRFSAVDLAEQGMKRGVRTKESFRHAFACRRFARHSRVRIGAYPDARIDLSRNVGVETMRNSTLAASAIAAGLAVAAPAKNAATMPVATPGQLGLAESAAGALEKTVLVCDPWTCYWRPDYWGSYRPYPYPNPYWSWRRHYWWGWHRPR